MNFVAEWIGVAVCLALVGEVLGLIVGYAVSRWRRASTHEPAWRADGRICGIAGAMLFPLAGVLPVGYAVIAGAVAGVLLYAPLPGSWRPTADWRRARAVLAVLTGTAAISACVVSLAVATRCLLALESDLPIVGRFVGAALLGAWAAFGLCESSPGQRLLRRVTVPAGRRWLGSRSRRLAVGGVAGLAGALALARHGVALPSRSGAVVAGGLLLAVLVAVMSAESRATLAAIVRGREAAPESVASVARAVLLAGVVGGSAGAIAMPAPWRWAGIATLVAALTPVSAASVRRARAIDSAGPDAPLMDPAVLRLIGLAIGVCGWLNGFTEPNVGGRADQIEHALRLSDLLLSIGWAGWPIGMWLASTIGGRLLERFGARYLLLVGTVVYWGAFWMLGIVSNWEEMLGAMFLVGQGNGYFDVAAARFGPWYEQQGQLARGAKAGLANQLQNAFFSAGSFVAALVTLAAVHFNVSLRWHLAAVSGLALTVIVGWAGWCLPNLKADDKADSAPTTAPPSPADLRERITRFRRRMLEAPWELRRAGVLVFCGALPVGVGYVWASVYDARLGAHGWLITAGLLAFTAFEMLARVLIGVLSKRYAWSRDPVKLTLTGGILGLAAIALITLPGELYLAILGFGLLAAATAPLGPLVQVAAQKLWPARKGAAAALVTRYSYTALVAGPVIIGPLSTGLGSASSETPLRIALGSLGVLFVVVILLRRNVRAAGVIDALGSSETDTQPDHDGPRDGIDD